MLSLSKEAKYDIMDFGCGTGELLGNISTLIGNDSNLIGFESDEKSVEEGRRKYPQVIFQNDEFIKNLEFPDTKFDIIISVDTLECVPDKSALINEFHRILKNDGRVLIAHWDWDTQVYNSENKNLMRKIVASFSDWQQGWMDACDGQMGRKLWGLFQGSGMFKGQIEIFPLIETEFKAGRYGYDRLQDLYWLVRKGELDATEHRLIVDEMSDLYKQGKYFYNLNSYIYLGLKV